MCEAQEVKQSATNDWRDVEANGTKHLSERMRAEEYLLIFFVSNFR